MAQQAQGLGFLPAIVWLVGGGALASAGAGAYIKSQADAAWNEASDYLFMPEPLTLPETRPGPAAPTSDQLRRGASWTPDDMIERTRQSTKNFWNGYQAGAQMSAGHRGSSESTDGSMLYLLLGLGALTGVLLITR